MSKLIDNKMNMVIVVVVILLISAAFTGCVEDDENGEEENDVDNGVENGLEGTETYSGEWSVASGFCVVAESVAIY